MHRFLALLVIVSTPYTAGVDAAGPCCHSCGHGNAKYVCRLVCTMRDQLTYEYEMDCEPYCMLGRSDSCGKKRVCDDSLLGFHWETIWKPNCECKVRTKRTLVKVPVVKQVPAYSCVVERICCGCGRNHIDTAATHRLIESGVMPVSADRPTIELDENLRPIPQSVVETTSAPPAVPQVEAAAGLPRLFAQ